MEDFKAEDAWAITKRVQLSNNPQKKRQIDNNTRQRMLTQWEWWRTNYVDEATDRSKHVPLGPTRKLLDVINGDELMQHTSPEEFRSASVRAKLHMTLSRFRHENQRAHQLALTNAAVSHRLLQSTRSNNFLANEMNRMTTGAVLSRASVGESRQTLRSITSALSVLDFVPEDSRPERLPQSPVPYYEDLFSGEKKRREVRMLYLERNPSSASIDLDIERRVASLSASAMSVYTPDLDSTAARIFPMTMNSLKECCPVIESKCLSLIWRNPAINPPIDLPKLA